MARFKHRNARRPSDSPGHPVVASMHCDHRPAHGRAFRAAITGAATMAAVCAAHGRPDEGLDCGWQYHFHLLDGTPEQLCLMGYDRRTFYDEELTSAISIRSQARPDANMPAVCMKPIPCNWRNASRQSRLEHYHEWKASVTGSASAGAKINLGEHLLRFLGLQISLTITVSGTVEYSESE